MVTMIAGFTVVVVGAVVGCAVGLTVVGWVKIAVDVWKWATR